MRYVVPLLLAILCAACSSTLPSLKPYRMDIQQGNVLDEKMMMQLRPAMTKSQVRFILGTPLIQDSFHKDRWDYFYQMRRGGAVVDQRRVILEFENDQLKRIRGDVVAATEKPAGSPSSAAETVEKAKVPSQTTEKGWLDKLKFWKDEPTPKSTRLETPAAVTATASSAASAAASTKAKAPDMAAKSQVAEQPSENKNTAAPEAQTAKPAPQATGVTQQERIPSASQVLADPAALAKTTPQNLESTVPSPLKSEPTKSATVATMPPSIASAEASVLPADGNLAATAEANITRAVYAWADAWQHKDIEAYLGFYAPQFKPEGLSRKAWESQRKQRLNKPGDILLQVDGLRVEAEANSAFASFVQRYSSKGYSDNVSKQLEFAQINGKWMIVRERVLSNLVKIDADPKSAIPSKSTVRDNSQDDVEYLPPPKLSPAQKSETMPELEIAPLPPMPQAVMPASAIPLEKTVDPTGKPAGKAVEPNPVDIGKPLAAEKMPQTSNQKAPEFTEEEKAKPDFFERMLEKIGF